MKKRFRGTYAELQDQVMLTGIFGEWRDLANHKQFRGDNGAILNWWELTGTISFQGPHLVTENLRRRFLLRSAPVKRLSRQEQSHVGHWQRVKNLQQTRCSKKRLRKLMIDNSVLKKRIG